MCLSNKSNCSKSQKQIPGLQSRSRLTQFSTFAKMTSICDYMFILAKFYFDSKSKFMANISTTCEKLKNMGFLLIKFLIIPNDVFKVLCNESKKTIINVFSINEKHVFLYLTLVQNTFYKYLDKNRKLYVLIDKHAFYTIIARSLARAYP